MKTTAVVILFAVLLGAAAGLDALVAASKGSGALTFLLLARIGLLVLLFFAVPQGLLLRILKVRDRWAYLITGLFSGWLFLFVFFLNSGVFAHDISSAVRFFIRDAGYQGFGLSALFGLLFGWLWSLRFYRLSGDNSRDWQTRVQPNNPADLPQPPAQ